MPRYVRGAKLEKRARKQLEKEDWDRAQEFLKRLAKNPPDPDLNFKPMAGHNRVLWEMKAGGQNRFVLRRTKDDQGDLFVVEDVGPHDSVYGRANYSR